MRHSFLAPFLILFAFFLASCRSHRQVVVDDVQPTNTSLSIVSKIQANQQDVGGIRSKINLILSSGNKSASVSGQLRMKRDEIIQISLIALGLLEVGRIELTPDYLLIQDRIHKQYMQVHWAEVPDLQRAGVDFNAFQSLFWNELFVPGKARAAEKDFTARQTTEGLSLYPTDDAIADHEVVAQFLVDATENLIQQTTVIPAKQARISLRCAYKEWLILGQKNFPGKMVLTVTQGSKRYTAEISLNRPQVDEKMGDLTTKVSNSYKRVTLDDILTQLTQKD